MTKPDPAEGVIEALEVSEWMYETRLQRLRQAAPVLSREEAEARLLEEDALRGLDIAGTRRVELASRQ